MTRWRVRDILLVVALALAVAAAMLALAYLLALLGWAVW